MGFLLPLAKMGAGEVADAQDLWVSGVLLDLPHEAGGICAVAVRVDLSCEEVSIGSKQKGVGAAAVGKVHSGR